MIRCGPRGIRSVELKSPSLSALGAGARQKRPSPNWRVRRSIPRASRASRRTARNWPRRASTRTLAIPRPSPCSSATHTQPVAETSATGGGAGGRAVASRGAGASGVGSTASATGGGSARWGAARRGARGVAGSPSPRGCPRSGATSTVQAATQRAAQQRARKERGWGEVDRTGILLGATTRRRGDFFAAVPGAKRQTLAGQKARPPSQEGPKGGPEAPSPRLQAMDRGRWGSLKLP